MVFNSVSFILFLIVVVALYWSLPRRPRLWLVFLSSCAFYSFWRVEFLPIVLLSTVTDYIVGLRLEKCRRKARRVAWLCLSLLINLGLLVYFKYALFFLDNLWYGLRLLGVESTPPALNIILPLGISFYTFQTISYSVDVYRGFIRAERDFVLYASYVTFFPQLVAGPILRAREVIGQLSHRTAFEITDIGMGLRRILYGLFLKVVLADNIAPTVDAGFAIPAEMLSAVDVWTLAFLFGFQIYFDFSAYSHIAVGSARLMGIRLVENFDYPYMVASPQDFWRRWHISLSSWIRDYLYLPLCGEQVLDRSDGGLGRQVSPVRQKGGFKKTRALFLTWAIMGLWHGANWTFVMWGLYHAVFIYAYRRSEGIRRELPESIRRYGGWAVTVPVIMLGWILFRTQSVAQALSMYGTLLSPRAYTWLGMRENTYLVTGFLLLLMIGLYLFKVRIAPAIQRSPILWASVETANLTVVITLVAVFLRPISQFIYFQF